MHTDHENDDESVEKIVFDDTYLNSLNEKIVS
jgi:hypothetical protein